MRNAAFFFFSPLPYLSSEEEESGDFHEPG
jgi:hypothetical protein